MQIRYRSAFTLAEVLISVGVIAFVAVAVLVVLNPVEIMRTSRDSRRVSELNTLSKTAYLYESDVQGSIGASSTVYVSIPDPQAATSAGSNCQSLGLPALPNGWSYHCAGPDYYRNIDGTGWVPIDFTGLSAGRPFEKLPVDPANSTSSSLYFTYATNGHLNYEFTSAMESKKYGLGGPEDIVSRDGGKYQDLFEIGQDVNLAPVDFGGGAGGAGQNPGGGGGASIYTFGGFQPPIHTDGSGVYNLGRTLPIKFTLTDANGNATTSAAATLVMTQIQGGVLGTNPVTLTSETNDTGNIFRVSSGQYMYNLDTGQFSAGTWQLKVVLNDGSDYAVLVSFNSF